MSHLDEFEFVDQAGDTLSVVATDRHPGAVVICTSDAVVMLRDDVRRLVEFLHGWLGDIDVTGLDKPPGSEYLPGRTP